MKNMFALIDGATVIDVVTNQFPVAPQWEWVQCDSSVKSGDTYDGTVFTSPVITSSKHLKSAMVDGEFRARISDGVQYDGRVFSVTPEDRNEIAGILEGARNGIVVFGGWGGMDAPNVSDVENGVYVIADFDALITWSTILFALSAELYKAWYAKQAEVRALTTQEEINAYDPATGWPEP